MTDMIDEIKKMMDQQRRHLLHEAMDKYFPGEPHLEQSTENELIFEAGFNRAWEYVEKNQATWLLLSESLMWLSEIKIPEVVELAEKIHKHLYLYEV